MGTHNASLLGEITKISCDYSLLSGTMIYDRLTVACDIGFLNPSPAEPRYTLSLQTV